jgi:serine/threonine-protein kinase
MVWQAGHLLNNGKYEILEVLGRGGFALTYKARNQDLDMEVVIKTPDILQKRDIEYEEYVKQFQAEGRKLAKFSQTPHPHIVRVWDIFMEGQVPCLVMDFIQGQTLMEKVKAQGKLSEAECLKYIRQIGEALEAVHQAGMVHRDAHPGNIMIQPNGNAILIDFGIAKEIIPASSSSTNSSANPSFAPYEQIYSGKPNRQPSVDIYSLAASFYYAVTGEKPTPSMERRLDDRPLKSPKEINPNLSEHLNTAIILGMALEKDDRPQLVSDWLQQLELQPPPVSPGSISLVQ